MARNMKRMRELLEQTAERENGRIHLHSVSNNDSHCLELLSDLGLMERINPNLRRVTEDGYYFIKLVTNPWNGEDNWKGLLELDFYGYKFSNIIKELTVPEKLLKRKISDFLDFYYEDYEEYEDYCNRNHGKKYKKSTVKYIKHCLTSKWHNRQENLDFVEDLAKALESPEEGASVDRLIEDKIEKMRHWLELDTVRKHPICEA